METVFFFFSRFSRWCSVAWLGLKNPLNSRLFSHLPSQLHSMPNTAGSPAADLSGSGGQAAVETPRSRDGGEHGLLSSLSRGASAAPGGSSSEGQRPRTCPVTHSREQFYTVCSDYALVNQAACLYHSSEHSAPAASLVQSLAEGQDHSSSSMTCEGDSAMEAVSASHTKPVLAWEIDTTDFDAVLIRMKSWTGESEHSLRNGLQLCSVFVHSIL